MIFFKSLFFFKKNFNLVFYNVCFLQFFIQINLYLISKNYGLYISLNIYKIYL